MAAQGSPLRRWKRFFAAFACIDHAIEAADPGFSRDGFRATRSQIVEILCDATDDGQAEELCRLLDQAMAESLETLQLVPVKPATPASTDLARTVDALRSHESERVRGLATAIVCGWRAPRNSATYTAGASATMAAQGGPLRRWKPFFAAFACIDGVIEAADPVLSRNELRATRGQIVEILCDATDDGQAEELCRLLDQAMAESLETLQLVPVKPATPASTDVRATIHSLRNHESSRVRALASSIIRGWTASSIGYGRHGSVGQDFTAAAQQDVACCRRR